MWICLLENIAFKDKAKDWVQLKKKTKTKLTKDKGKKCFMYADTVDVFFSTIYVLVIVTQH